MANNNKVNLGNLIDNGKLYFSSEKNRNDLFSLIADGLYKEGYVKDSFLEALKLREAQFPTGLISNLYNIAVPHVDSEHINKNALITVILDTPIRFHRMDVNDEEIDVKVVFFLLIKNREHQAQAISNLTKLWQNDYIMESILSVKNKEEYVNLIDAVCREVVKPKFKEELL